MQTDRQIRHNLAPLIVADFRQEKGRQRRRQGDDDDGHDRRRVHDGPDDDGQGGDDGGRRPHTGQGGVAPLRHHGLQEDVRRWGWRRRRRGDTRCVRFARRWGRGRSQPRGRRLAQEFGHRQAGLQQLQPRQPHGVLETGVAVIYLLIYWGVLNTANLPS